MRSFIIFYALPNVIRVVKSKMMKWAGRIARIGDMRNAYKSFVVKRGRKRPFGRPRCRWGR
jgi:hypothetical protein